MMPRIAFLMYCIISHSIKYPAAFAICPCKHGTRSITLTWLIARRNKIAQNELIDPAHRCAQK